MKSLSAFALLAAFSLAGCHKTAASPVEVTTADGYPIGKVAAALSSACSDLSTIKAAYKKALADGWTVVENPEQSEAAGYISAITGDDAKIRLAQAGEDMILVPIMQRNVGGERLFLSLYEHRTQIDQTNECKLFDVGERRHASNDDLAASLGLGAGDTKEHKTSKIVTWDQGLSAGQRHLEYAELEENPINLQVFGLSGFMFHASQSAPLASN